MIIGFIARGFNMKRIRRRNLKLSKVYVDKEIKIKLLQLRNEHGFIDANHVIKYLLDGNETMKNITTETKPAIPAIVPKPTINPNIKEVTCPGCKLKFVADTAKTIKCINCGLEGKSS